MPDSRGSVLLLGNYRPTICLVRELKALGYRTVVGRGGGEGGAERSRFTDEVWDHPPLGADPAAFVHALAALLGRRPEIRVVFPVAEAFVRAVSAARDRLPADRVYAIPDGTGIDVTLDKVAAYALAASVGVPVAPYAIVGSTAALRERSAAIGYPVVIRPLDSTRRLGDEKALIVRSEAELPRWPPGQAALLVQRYATGRRHNLYFAAQAGRLVRLVEAVIDRTDRADDTGLAVEGRTVASAPDLTLFTERLTAALRYTGVGCAQFQVDRRTGAVSFLEVNPRIGGNHAIAAAAGLELGSLSIVLASPDAPAVPFVGGRAGLRYAWTYGDLRGFARALASGLPPGSAVRWAVRLVRALVRADVHVTWRRDDPLPTLALYARTLRALPAALRRRPALRRLARRPEYDTMSAR
jgi:biotin carboxylase